MGTALSVTWRSILSVYGDLFPMVGMNLLWLVFSTIIGVMLVPVMMLALAAELPVEPISIMIGLLMVIMPNPAAAGIHNYLNRLVKEELVEFGHFWEGLRKYGARSALLFAVNLVAIALLAANIDFYLSSEHLVLRLVGTVFLYVLYLFLTMQLYMLPLLVEQEDKSLKLIYRNAALLAMGNPLVSLVLLVTSILIVGLSLVVTILIVFVTGSLIAAIEHQATLTLLEKYRARGKGAKT